MEEFFFLGIYVLYLALFAYIITKLTNEELRVMEQRNRAVFLCLYLAAMGYVANYLYWDMGRHWWFNAICAIPIYLWLCYRFQQLIFSILDGVMDRIGL